MKLSPWRKYALGILSVSLLNMGMMSAASAAIVDTSVLVATDRDADLGAIRTQLARADVRHDPIEAALHVERDEGGAVGVAPGSTDGDGRRVALVVVVVRAAVHRALGDGGQIHQAGRHRDLRTSGRQRRGRRWLSFTVTLNLRVV